MSRGLRRFMLEGGHRGEITMIKVNIRNKTNETETDSQRTNGGGRERGCGVAGRELTGLGTGRWLRHSQGRAAGAGRSQRPRRDYAWRQVGPGPTRGGAGGGLTNDVNV